MNLEQMQIELSLIVKDASLQPLLVGWINAAILDVATDYDLPPLALAEPYSLGWTPPSGSGRCRRFSTRISLW